MILFHENGLRMKLFYALLDNMTRRKDVDVKWIHLAQDTVPLCTLLNTVLNPQVQQNTEQHFLTI